LPATIAFVSDGELRVGGGTVAVGGMGVGVGGTGVAVGPGAGAQALRTIASNRTKVIVFMAALLVVEKP
jgi:hypothetical protein